MAEKDRVARARLAVDKGRTIDWRSMLMDGEVKEREVVWLGWQDSMMREKRWEG